MSYGKKQITLAAARINSGLTQIEAAEKIGVSKSTIGNWEKGKTKPDVNDLKKIEDVYGLSYNDIYFF